MNKKKEASAKNRSYEEGPMGILKVENTIAEIKSSVAGFNGIMGRMEEKVSELEDRTI